MSQWQPPQYDPDQHRQRIGAQPPQHYPPVPYGQPYPPPYAPPGWQRMPVAPKSTAAGLLLGLLLPGLGCMYAGRAGLGAAILICWIVSLFLVLFVIGWILAPACWITSGALGYTTAQAWNRDHGILS